MKFIKRADKTYISKNRIDDIFVDEMHNSNGSIFLGIIFYDELAERYFSMFEKFSNEDSAQNFLDDLMKD